MWVGQLRVKEELEVVVELHLLLTKLDVHRPALLEQATSNDVCEYGFDSLSHVLDEDTVASFDRAFHDSCHVLGCHPCNLQVAL